ncbi:hypothetical protein QMA56_02465 [Leuconostoc falkenbergense]|uniref:hypothetical protein n=1 Tax=Leuconostoc falkenbergense TaxID=2766470 RepID=UPI0024AE4189|nr:hypothetical protein [Leuconostoc falkenbergense]MDI6666568.1 hypothetical protein [Leuconostoc falkenbergense]
MYFISLNVKWHDKNYLQSGQIAIPTDPEKETYSVFEVFSNGTMARLNKNKLIDALEQKNRREDIKLFDKYIDEHGKITGQKSAILISEILQAEFRSVTK